MRKRSIKKTFYLSEEENKVLKEKSEKVGYSESEIIRSLIMDFIPVEKPEKEFYEYLKHLRILTNNSNQIATRLNSNEFVDKKDIINFVTMSRNFIIEVREKFLICKKK